MRLLETGGQLATQIAGWLGVGEKRQDKRQVEQQGKLNDVNAKTAKELADYEQALKMKMWKDTNYGAQLKQAEMAGVSKAAVLGGNGSGAGGGASVGSVGGGNAADAAAAQNAATNQAMSMAQIANLNANTKKTEVEAQNMGAEGIGGQNVQADTAVKQATAKIQEVAANVAKTTEYEAVRQIVGAANEQIEKAREQFNKAQVAEETQRAEIQKIQAEAAGELVKNSLMRSEIGKNAAQVNEISNSIKQKWAQVKQGQEQVNINKFKEEIKASYPAVWDILGRVLDNALDETYQRIHGRKKDVHNKMK